MTPVQATVLRRVILLRRWEQILEDWKESILNGTRCDYTIWVKSLEDWRKSMAEFKTETKT
jgi:hypothetical protein